MNVDDARSRLRTPHSGKARQPEVDRSTARPVRRPWYEHLLRLAAATRQPRHGAVRATTSTPRPASRTSRLRTIVQYLTRCATRIVSWLRRRSRRQQLLILTGCLIALWYGTHLSPATHSPSSSPAVRPPTSSPPAVLPKETPPFPTLLPVGKNISELGGWTRISPTDNAATYAFVDHIGTVQINVSQQILPESFRSTPEDSLRTLAESFDARETIKAGDTTVYIGTSTKGPQSIIFAKNNLLVLIKSSSRIAEPLWTNYIKDLN